MDVTQTILHYPPLTSNNLDTRQRARLIRTTRKLGAILGTTPRLAEPEPIPITLLPIGKSSTDLYRRGYEAKHGYSQSCSAQSSAAASVYASSSTNSSAASLPLPPPRSSTETLPMPKSFSSRPRRSADAPRPLVLRLNAVPVDAGDVRVPMSPFTATTVPACRSPLTPITPLIPSEAEVRRKRMAKLARTLGENVPPEMVFSTAHPRTAANGRKMVGSQSRPICITPPPRRSSRVWITGSKMGTWTGEWNRRDIEEVQQKLRALKAR